MTVVLMIVVNLYLFYRQPAPPEVSEAPSEPAPAVPRSVVVAARDIGFRELITPDALTLSQTVAGELTDAFTDANEVAFRVAKTFIKSGEPILRRFVSEPVEQAGATWLIPPGKLGYSLTLTRPERSVPVRAGDRIRIYGVFAGVQALPLVDRVLVLAVDNRVGDRELSPEGAPRAQTAAGQGQTPQAPPGAGDKQTFFVALTPAEIQKLILASDSGATLHYALLPPSDPLLAAPPEPGRPLRLSEVTGWRELEESIARRNQVTIETRTPPPRPAPQPPLITRTPTIPLPPVAPPPPPPAPKPIVPSGPPKEKTVIGVVGDQRIVFSAATSR